MNDKSIIGKNLEKNKSIDMVNDNNNVIGIG